MKSGRWGTLALLAGAASWGIAGAVSWFSRDYQDPLTGPVTVSLHGASVVPLLWPGALIALAGLAAGSLSRGWIRRSVGALTALVGLGGGVWIVIGLADRIPIQELAGQLRRPATALADAQRMLWGPALGVIGGALILTAGVALAMRASGPARRRSHAYETPAARRDHAHRTAAAATGELSDAAKPPDSEWWQAIDAGIDPTVGSAQSSETPPDTMN